MAAGALRETDAEGLTDGLYLDGGKPAFSPGPPLGTKHFYLSVDIGEMDTHIYKPESRPWTSYVWYV